MFNLSNFGRHVVQNVTKLLNQQSKLVTQNSIAPFIGVSHYIRCNSSIQISTQPLTKTASEVFSNINKTANTERLFAVVQICGKQFKVTPGDIVIIEGYWAPDIGDKLKLEKVLAVGSNSFSIIGRPLVDKNLVDINATIIEKTLSHTRTHFKKKRRKQYMRINFLRSQNTMVMINSIDIKTV